MWTNSLVRPTSCTQTLLTRCWPKFFNRVGFRRENHATKKKEDIFITEAVQNPPVVWLRPSAWGSAFRSPLAVYFFVLLLVLLTTFNPFCSFGCSLKKTFGLFSRWLLRLLLCKTFILFFLDFSKHFNKICSVKKIFFKITTGSVCVFLCYF